MTEKLENTDNINESEIKNEASAPSEKTNAEAETSSNSIENNQDIEKDSVSDKEQIPDSEQNDDQDKEQEQDAKKLDLRPLIIIGTALVVIIAVIAVLVKLGIWNKGVEYIITEADLKNIRRDTSDSIALLPESVASPTTTDGVTNVLIFGNDSYLAGSEDGTDIVSQFTKEFPETNFINCCLPNTLITSNHRYELSPEECPEEYFSLFWLSAAICWDDFERQYQALNYLDPDEYDVEKYREVVKTLEQYKVSDIDVVMLCYDGHDYQRGRVALDMRDGSPDTENPTTALGAIYNCVLMFNAQKSEIQYVYVCPAFCFAFDEDGKKQSCNTYNTSNGTIASTHLAAKSVANYFNVSYSYIDMYTGVDIGENNGVRYLLADGVTPNEKARRMIADRLVTVLKGRLK